MRSYGIESGRHPATETPWSSDDDSPWASQDISGTQPSHETGVHGQFEADTSYRGNEDTLLHPSTSPLDSATAVSQYYAGVWLFLTVLISSIVVIAFESFVFAKFQSSVTVAQGNEQLPEVRTIPTYLALFLFAAVFQLVMIADSLYAQNTIEIIGQCVFALAMTVYGAIQYSQIKTAIIHLSSKGIYDMESWPVMRAFLITMPCILAAATIIMLFFAYQLYRELGWAIYKYIGADRRLHSHYLRYQIFITLVKFDFFFFIGFTVQFIVVVLQTKDVEFALTIAVIPVTILFLAFTYWAVRHESKAGMAGVLVGLTCGLAYFIFKLVRIYTPERAYKYVAVRKSLTGFAVITIVLLLCTAVNAAWCIYGFGRGLKAVFKPTEVDELTVPLNVVKRDSFEFTRPMNRMTID